VSQRLILPPSNVVDSIHGSVTRVTRRVEIYEEDGSTFWKQSSEVGLVGGDVTVDSSRDERRMLSLTLDNSDGSLALSPNGLWYDKIIKAYRGVITDNGTRWEAKVGEFMIDQLNQDRFPHVVALTGRDYTKKLMLDKFTNTTGFPRNQPIEEIIRTIALNGGILAAKMNLPLTGKSTLKEYYFDRAMTRWDAIKQLATDGALDVYFDREGVMRLETFTDPYLDAPQYTFQTGLQGNISDFKKSLNDSMLFNHYIVTGGTDDPENSLPPFAVAENRNASSPTSIQQLGRRSTDYQSDALITTQQCQDVADKFLSVAALEQFSCSIDAIVVPYLEAGITVNFLDPNPVAGQPTKYLLDSLTVPLGLGTMPATVKRVIAVN
jgi:hypothetical protein